MEAREREGTATLREPHNGVDRRHERIQGLFDDIAPRYDFLNHLLSLNLDRRWRRRAVAALAPRPGVSYLDACAGTGDLAFALAARLPAGMGARVFATDFSLEMLRIGLRKSERAGPAGPRFLAGDTLRLPFESGVFQGALVGFGIRNVEDLGSGLRELRRVLRPGGRLVVLEFTPLRNRVLRPLVDFYTRRIMPRIGNLLSGTHTRAYSYLQESMDEWLDGAALARAFEDAGFRSVRWEALFPGIVALHAGER